METIIDALAIGFVGSFAVHLVWTVVRLPFWLALALIRAARYAA